MWVYVCFVCVVFSSIVEKAGEAGQEKELKLSTVTYRTEGEAEKLDLTTVCRTSGLYNIKHHLF